jgi:phosphoribosylanthranilate isomerase
VPAAVSVLRVDIGRDPCHRKPMVEIKICGIREPEALDAALAEAADFVGLVFYPPSPRHLSLAEGAALAARARGRAAVVALTVDASPVEIDAIIEAVRPDVLQLHGGESAATAAALRRRVGAVWKAAAVTAKADIRQAAGAYPAVDRLLFDARPPAGAGRPGGNGRAFRWSVFRGLSFERSFVLSGGLNPANVADAIARTGAPAVDVSSGVERAPGMKDPDLIRAFVRAARAAGTQREAAQ